MTLEGAYEGLVRFLEWRLFALGNTTFTVGSVVTLVLGVAAALVLAGVFRAVVRRWLVSRTHLSRPAAYAFGRTIQYITLLTGLLVTLHIAGLNLSGLAMAVGFLSVGIGFGLQNVTSNFVSGLILMLERPMKVGDWVAIGEMEGEVRELNMRSTTVRSADNVFVIVPNSEFISNKIVNWSNPDPLVRIGVDLEVAQDSDMAVVRETLLSVARENPVVLDDPGPSVQHCGLGDSTWRVRLLVWLERPDQYVEIRSRLWWAAVDAFRERGIQTGNPTRDLNLNVWPALPADLNVIVDRQPTSYSGGR